MYVFVLSLHVVLCILLVLIVLMQPGKGADISSAFGGGSSSQLFGAAGPGNFLTKGTGLIATLFMVTSITLALYSTEANMSGVNSDDALEEALEAGEAGSGFGAGGATPAPATPASAPATPAPEPTAPAGGDAAPAPAEPAPATPPTP